ncbi:replication restart helicase PriA [Ammonifex thiophilus]|uniref:Replication restart protein PriA n=1 Tax=Ammonifex thiophilus TaxID=444093 RepID=A0A3D8P5U5_9THEO|nr:primosomal protein N' [Ammonifex thiophilus]RDV83450.1 primosomal protein N' [Ammonifex thiophilus]
MTERGEKVVQVAVALPLPPGKEVFSYCLPPELAEKVVPGARVAVPFRGRLVAGVVVELKEEIPEGVKELKPVTRVEEAKPLPPKLLRLGEWLAERYLCSLGEALLALTAPPGEKEECYFPAEDRDLEEAIEVLSRRFPAQARALAVVVAFPGIDRLSLLREAGVKAQTLDALWRKGLIRKEKASFKALPFPSTPPETGLSLTPAQAKALSRVEEALNRKTPAVLLLHGVTGSGKTEVYLRAASLALAQGRQVIVLVPEIVLAYQVVEQFRSRFGDRVAVLHSALGERERGTSWQRVERGEAPVVIGARSAVFAPVSHLGLIVLDEEHEPAYKQEQVPRYHAREVALVRAAQDGAVVLLGSATPSLETYARALAGHYELLKLPQRVDGSPLPRVRLVDLREEHRRGMTGVFSHFLLERVKEKLKRGEQVILFLNRRGFAAFVLCRSCGRILRCPYCDIALTFYRPDLLLCHYCHYRIRRPQLSCPYCGKGELELYGAGTQRLEAEIKALFPEARIARLDAETTSRRGSHGTILSAVARREVDILVGTQMVAKGLNLPGVTLVGVVNADITLSLPDFRAAERTFQLLYQVAGRAGRGGAPGEVVIQSYCPEHYAIYLSARQDFSTFARRELALRRRFEYPPFTHLARVVFTGVAENKVREQALRLRELLLAEAGDEIAVLGPAPCPLGKLKGFWRWHIILKGRKAKSLREILRKAMEQTRRKAGAEVKMVLDVDPLNML